MFYVMGKYKTKKHACEYLMTSLQIVNDLFIHISVVVCYENIKREHWRALRSLKGIKHIETNSEQWKVNGSKEQYQRIKR